MSEAGPAVMRTAVRMALVRYKWVTRVASDGLHMEG